MHGGARSERVARAGEEGKCAEMGGGNKYVALGHPGVELRANLKSISNRCSLWKIAFEGTLTKETIYLLLGCLLGAVDDAIQRTVGWRHPGREGKGGRGPHNPWSGID